ncbi:hypothetical protein IC229_10435 [Spirosoma sp. BT702]|uniref:Galactose oxidase n=1 Tax=Spirosoma profusum TaxID=2771354 RepID=A0A927ATT5_9BACT|nr:hypothetical protein [Spirosoma profusum]MBD2701052.1 hypothetical protein [Spirosoma profusum]
MKAFFFVLLVLLIAGCKKKEDSTPVTPEITVNDIVLTPKQLGVPITTFDAGNYPILSVLVGNSIYFGNWSNTAKAQFMVRYSISSNTFSSALAKSSNVCGCGYSSRLVSDGTNIFYIANDATKYTASSNTWANITYPTTAKDNNGEAGVGYYNGNIYFVGGRTASNLFKYYTISQDKWFTAPNYPFATNRSQIVAYKDRLYVLGGENAKRKISYFSTTSNTWTTLQDATFDINTSYESTYAAVLGEYLYLLQNDSIYVYDIQKDVWAAQPIKLEGLPSYGNLFSDGQKLFIAGKNTANIPVVFEVTPGFK